MNINLWAGLGMLVFGVLMLTWALTRPLSEELGHERGGLTRGAAGRPGSTTSGPDWARTTPGGSSASTEPPKPPPTMRAPAAPASSAPSTVRSTSGTDAS